jgi:hypothetical protein
MPDDLIGCEWFEYDSVTRTLKAGVAFEDGSGGSVSVDAAEKQTAESLLFPSGQMIYMSQKGDPADYDYDSP